MTTVHNYTPKAISDFLSFVKLEMYQNQCKLYV